MTQPNPLKTNISTQPNPTRGQPNPWTTLGHISPVYSLPQNADGPNFSCKKGGRLNLELQVSKWWSKCSHLLPFSPWRYGMRSEHSTRPEFKGTPQWRESNEEGWRYKGIGRRVGNKVNKGKLDGKLQVDLCLSKDFPLPTGSAVLVVRTGGGWINCVRITTLQPLYCVPPSGEAISQRHIGWQWWPFCQQS